MGKYKKKIKLPPPLPGHDSRSPYIDILPDISKKLTTTDSGKISTIGNFKLRKHTNAYWQKRSEQRLGQFPEVVDWLRGGVVV